MQAGHAEGLPCAGEREFPCQLGRRFVGNAARRRKSPTIVAGLAACISVKVRQTVIALSQSKAGVPMTDQPDLPQGETRSERQKSSDVVVNLHEYRSSNLDPLPITFHRRELDMILRIYGRMVGEGEWRDYAMDHLREKAVFSVFKRSGEMPLFRIEKNPKLSARQGAFSVVNTHGMILKRGHDLQQVLKVFDKMLKVIKT
jgi:hypothetical protein